MSKLLEKFKFFKNLRQDIVLYFWVFQTLFLKGLGVTGYVFIFLEILKSIFNLLNGVIYGWFSAQVIELIINKYDISYLFWSVVSLTVFYLTRRIIEIWSEYIKKG